MVPNIVAAVDIADIVTAVGALLVAGLAIPVGMKAAGLIKRALSKA